MNTNKFLLKKLKNSLPRGSVRTIWGRLKENEDIPKFSLGYVYRVLDPDQSDFNTMIVNEAAIFAEEIAKRNKKLEERITKNNYRMKTFSLMSDPDKDITIESLQHMSKLIQEKFAYPDILTEHERATLERKFNRTQELLQELQNGTG